MLALRRWISAMHSPRTESAIYATYEAARGMVANTGGLALHHAHEIVALERTLHLFIEPSVQRLARSAPGLLATLSTAYLTLHLVVTIVVLVWLYYRRPAAFATVRTTLMVASGLSLIGFLAFPTAPPA
jgi:hypothetical protein